MKGKYFRMPFHSHEEDVEGEGGEKGGRVEILIVHLRNP